ncbi:hypothetical protein V6N12_027793 [Hibiscus sabdariffa]|uniref:Dihydroxy-acid dehydratase n=1 Tax=Hibiscus sabdariffa TaxID=183260 RepID=A0ABR2F3Z1_9ROSI
MPLSFLASRATVLSTNRLSLTTATNRRQRLRRTAQFQATVRADSSFPSTLKLSKHVQHKKKRAQVTRRVLPDHMLSGVGLSEDDLSKPQVGIWSMWYEGNTCNMHLLKLSSEAVKRGVEEHGMVGVRVMTSMGMGEVGNGVGTRGMTNSLYSRDFIADSIETVMSAQWYDGYISITGGDRSCDGENVSGKISDDQRNCTTNIMASAIEVMGMSLPCSSSISAEDPLKLDECRLAGKYLHELLNMDIKPRDIITHKSLRNAMVVVRAVGGSADDVLDLIAIARSVGLELTSNDFQKVSDEVPFLADVHKTGGTPAVIRYLLDHKYLDGDCMTVTGKTLAENAESYPRLPDGQDVALLSDGRFSGGSHGFVIGHICPEAQGPQGMLEMWWRACQRVGAFLWFQPDWHSYIIRAAATVIGARVAALITKLMAKLPWMIPLLLGEFARNFAMDYVKKILNPVSNPIRKTGLIQILRGNLAPESSVAEITGKEGLDFSGPALFFEGEEALLAAISENPSSFKGKVVVIRGEGPKGGPGMPEILLKPTSAIMGAGLGKDAALLTDGRFSGGSHGFVVGHLCPEAQGPQGMLGKWWGAYQRVGAFLWFQPDWHSYAIRATATVFGVCVVAWITKPMAKLHWVIPLLIGEFARNFSMDYVKYFAVNLGPRLALKLAANLAAKKWEKSELNPITKLVP